MRAGAEVDAGTSSRRTPLHYACMHTSSIAETSYETYKHSRQRRRYIHSFFRGITGMKNSELLALLPVQVYTGDELQRQLDVAKLLLSHRATPFISDERSLSPLHYASFFGAFEVVRLLLSENDKSSFSFPDLSTNLPTQNTFSRYPLPPPPITPILLDLISSKIDLPDSNALTPLMYAAAANHLTIAALLLSYKSSPTLSHRWTSAIGLAIQYRHVEMVKLLLKAKEKSVKPSEDYLHLALKSNEREIVLEVLKYEENINARQIALLPFVVCEFDESNATYYTSLLLEKGADPRATDEATHSTPLHLAIAKNYTEIVKMLVARGNFIFLKK